MASPTLSKWRTTTRGPSWQPAGSRHSHSKPSSDLGCRSCSETIRLASDEPRTSAGKTPLNHRRCHRPTAEPGNILRPRLALPYSRHSSRGAPKVMRSARQPDVLRLARCLTSGVLISVQICGREGATVTLKMTRAGHVSADGEKCAGNVTKEHIGAEAATVVLRWRFRRVGGTWRTRRRSRSVNCVTVDVLPSSFILIPGRTACRLDITTGCR